MDFTGHSTVISQLASSANNVIVKRCRLTRLHMDSVDRLSIWDNSSGPRFRSLISGLLCIN